MTTRPTRDQELADRTADLLGLADVKRWGVIRMMRDQSVAEHSFNVAVIAVELSVRLGQIPDGVLEWAIFHDAPETLSADIDGKFKRDNPDLRAAIVAAERKAFPWYADYITQEVSPRINAIVKTADKMEAIAFIRAYGIGARADDVYQELLYILDHETIPKLESAIAAPGVTSDGVHAVVHALLNRITGETNNVQLRRHRRKP